MTPKYAKQPATLKPGAWVRFKSDRYARIRGQVQQIVRWDYFDGPSITTEDAAGRDRNGTVEPRDIELLTAEEAAPFIAARSVRIERERHRKANQLPNVSGNNGIYPTRRRWS